MKTTPDIPDDILRQVKARAALRGISLRRFVAERPLRRKSPRRPPPGASLRSRHGCGDLARWPISGRKPAWLNPASPKPSGVWRRTARDSGHLRALSLGGRKPRLPPRFRCGLPAGGARYCSGGISQYGIRLSRHRARYEQWLAQNLPFSEVRPVTAAAADHYAVLCLHLKSKGTPILSNDLWIAAPAAELRLPLLSNDSHFGLIPGLHRLSF